MIFLVCHRGSSGESPLVTAVRDGFPKFTEKYFKCHEALVLLICVISLLLGLPNVLQVSAFVRN